MTPYQYEFEFETLNLSRNNINAFGLQHICSALIGKDPEMAGFNECVRRGIKHLDISENDIRDESLKVLYPFLQKNKGLRSIKYTLYNEENKKVEAKYNELASLGKNKD